jgi:hypothetical protein
MKGNGVAQISEEVKKNEMRSSWRGKEVFFPDTLSVKRVDNHSL